MKRIIGIYLITNTANGKKYLGSSVDVMDRFRRHKGDLKNNRHANKFLQRSWNKYGEEAFLFEIFEDVGDEDYLKIIEQWYLDTYQCANSDIFYNIAKDSRGFTPEEARKTALKFHSSPGAKEKVSNALKRAWSEGKHNLEHIKSLSEVGVAATVKKHNTGPILQVDCDTNQVVGIYKNSYYVKCNSDFYDNNIKKSIKYGSSAYGYYWLSAKDNLELFNKSYQEMGWTDCLERKSKKTMPSLRKKVYQFDLDGNLIRQFASVKEAASFLGLNVNVVCKEYRSNQVSKTYSRDYILYNKSNCSEKIKTLKGNK